jgi:hypothetical protein
MMFACREATAEVVVAVDAAVDVDARAVAEVGELEVALISGRGAGEDEEVEEETEEADAVVVDRGMDKESGATPVPLGDREEGMAATGAVLELGSGLGVGLE